MSSTIIISCISSVLHDAEMFVDYTVRYDLRFLKTFVLCGKKLRQDASFKHFLVRIEEHLRKYTAKLHGFCEAEAGDESQVAERFKQFTNSLGKEMHEWYVTILDCNCAPHSTSLMSTNEIMDIITSISESIVDWSDEIDSLRVQMMFLKSLIQFVAKGSTEASKELLAHSETIAINTAYILFCGRYHNSNKKWKDVLCRVSTWVQKMKPIDPQVYEIYTQSLSNSKLSKQLLDDDALFVVKNFLDSLMSILAQILWLDTGHGLMKDPLQEVYEKLRFLGILIKQRSIETFGMEIQQEILDVVTDTGISICSIYHAQIDLDFEHQFLLDKFKILLLKMAVRDAEIPIFNSPRTSSYGFVDSILEKLREMKSSRVKSTTKSHAQTIQLELACVRSTLGENVELHDERVEVQTCWNRLLEVVLKVENAIDYQVVDPFSDSLSFDSIIDDIGNIKADVLKIEVKEERSETYSHPPSQKTLSMSKEVIGFQVEERAVLDRLRGGSQHLQIIAIVGMPGIGKTTLAKKVYNHSSLSLHFSAMAWCTVSQVLEKKKVLFGLMKQTCPGIPFEMSEHDIADRLRRSLKGKRYLIFLDDIWSAEAWNNLKDSFPNDDKGSRIILTSRSHDIASREMPDQEPVLLSPLGEEDSLKLLGNVLYPGQELGLPLVLHGMQMQIVARCGGLPLAIIILAGTLANTKADTWEHILGSFSFLSSDDNCRNTLEFSYRHLPYYLRPCFLYFGVFAEDQEVSVWKLLRLWIAEGFVRKSETSSLEDVAKGYLNSLINRSLIMADKLKSDGAIKTCHIHDLLRDFCLEKAKDEHFFHFPKGADELYSFTESPNVRRLLIVSESKALRDSKFYCPHARSLLFRGSEQSKQVYQGMSSMLQFFKLLKVLDLEQIDISGEFPIAIKQLVLLAFLAIKGYKFTTPLWLANLSNLETLILRGCRFSLPYNLWKMQKLKYLYSHHGVLPIDNLDNSHVLYELERLRGVILDWCSREKQFRKFPNIRKLKCILENMYEAKYVETFAFPDFSSKLESLDMHGSRRSLHMFGRSLPDFGVRFEFSSLTNLKMLKLSGIYLYWEFFSAIGNQLPSLEVLKLHQLIFKDEEDYIWEMRSGEFSKLRILHVNDLPLQRWISSDDHEFDCFQKLVLHNCHEIVELPSCLEMIETLEAIKVSFCSKAVQDLVTNIELAQNHWGNFIRR